MGKSSLHALPYFLVIISEGEPMTGKELLKTIKRERQQLEKLKKEHQEEEKHFQVLHGVNYENMHGSGGRVSTLDDVLERQEAGRARYARRYILAYSSYCDHLQKAWEIAGPLIDQGVLDVMYMMDYYSNNETYGQTAKALKMSQSYFRELVGKAAAEFERAYQVRYPPETSD